MTLQQLQYVIALDTHRHFVRAAKSCFVAQPTLTIQLKKLEEEVQMAIFDRSQQPIRPTPMGEIFILKARQILGEVEQLKALVNREKETMEGQFRLGVIPTIAPYLLSRFLPEFMQQHQKTQLNIQELQSEDIITKLKKGELDIGLMATPIKEKSIREIPLFYEPFLVYANRENDILEKTEVSATDLRAEELWLLGQGHCFRKHSLNYCQLEQEPRDRNLVMDAGSIETLKNMIQRLSGYTLIPHLSFDEEKDGKNCLRFADPQPVREVSLVVHQHFTKELLLTELRKSITRNVPEAFRKNDRFLTIEWR
ncbi:hydrogen peroxide-inducible genes activator [Lewinella sp. W8]|uniref:hydrogen peroxide-inducible genes activator n=1 Tax=Lewinella sp. W8 TaxID=2528208 RepID=UPI0010673C1B|nr:hydrogen peroxide-inducible genes activator [Lewinella sp. W8]MTB51426.1 LysR family transcriptional regulator [Lewinella sp. W8]